MKKWEYCAVKGISAQMRNLHPTFPAMWYFGVEGIQSVDLKGDEANQVAYTIAKLGEEGWEMAGCGQDGTASHVVYFKREIEQ